MMWDATIPAVPNQHSGMRPYQFTLGDEAAMRPLPEVRDVTGFLNRNDLYRSAPMPTHRGRCWAWSQIILGCVLCPSLKDDLLTRPISPSGGGWWCSDRRMRMLLFLGHPMMGETITINDIAFTVVGTPIRSVTATTTAKIRRSTFR